MNTKEQLQQELVDINEEVHDITNQADAENRDLTKSEDKAINKLFNQFKIVETDLSMHESQGRVAAPQPIATQHNGMTRPQQADINTSQRKPYAGRKMADLFGKATTNKADGFKSNAE